MRKMPVLLVEDSIDDIMLVKRAFDKARILHPLHTVCDGDQALDYLKGINHYAERATYPLPVLILLDLKLPRRSGLEVLRWLKATTELRRIPVIVLTSSRENIDIDRAYELGVNSYLVKPVAFDELLELIRALNLYWLVMNEQPTVTEA
jgi:CheY-like chemotaxis protein